MNQCAIKIIALIALLIISTVSLAENYSKSYYQGRVKVNYEDDDQGQKYQPYSQSHGEYYSRNYRPQAFQMPIERAPSPVALLEESINKVIDFLSQPQQASMDQITYFLNHEISPHFDFKYMARWVAGRHYKNMSPEKRKEFTETFIGLFVTTFVKKLTHFQDYPPVVGDFVSKRISKNEATASVNVYQESGAGIQVDFKFMKTKNGWKVIDVRANGISALLYYRNYFLEQIQRSEQHRAVFK